jgi:hypothetical protein
MSKFIGLHDDHGQFSETLLRNALRANARYACDAENGRVEKDPVFEEVTEKRQTFNGYSSCGDLIHWSLRRAGLRDEKILNRTDDDGKMGWQVAVNISRLVYGTGSAFEHWNVGTPFNGQPGDMGLIGDTSETTHVFIIEDVSGDQITSWDYGQFFNGKHGGKRVVRHLVPGANGRVQLISSTYPGRPWIGRLNMFALLKPYFDANTIVPAEVPDDFPIAEDRVIPY